MGTRLDFQGVLEGVLGSRNVYFQPPTNVQMSYPAIVYNRDYEAVQYGDNRPYNRRLRYQVTVIDPNPDSPIPSQVGELSLAAFVRHFTMDNLNHDIFDVYF